MDEKFACSSQQPGVQDFHYPFNFCSWTWAVYTIFKMRVNGSLLQCSFKFIPQAASCQQEQEFNRARQEFRVLSSWNTAKSSAAHQWELIALWTGWLVGTLKNQTLVWCTSNTEFGNFSQPLLLWVGINLIEHCKHVSIVTKHFNFFVTSVL